MVKATAVCRGAATIITGFACGRGGAFGLCLENKATVKLAEEGINSEIMGLPGKNADLMDYCVEEVLKHTGLKSGARVTAEPTMPLGVGLKSSSVAANAVVLATVEALSKREGVDWRSEGLNGVELSDMDLINLGVEAAFRAGVTSTGALDDASAAYFGGYTITHNLERKILGQGEIEDLDVLVFIPQEHVEVSSGGVDIDYIQKYSRQVEYVWNRALEGDVLEAVTLNGILHSVIFDYGMPATKLALEAGALSAGLSGTGPAVVAVCEDPDGVKEAWMSLPGKIIQTRTNNRKAWIEE